MTLGAWLLASLRSLLGTAGGTAASPFPPMNVTRTRRVIARRIVKQVPPE